MTDIDKNVMHSGDENAKKTVRILSPGYTARQALTLLLHTDPALDLRDIEEVYYPYVRFRYLITVGKGRLMEKLNKLSDCIVDRVNGSTYEAKGEPEYDTCEAWPEDMLDIVVPMSTCYDTAHDFTMKMYISKGKLMMTPKMEIIEEDEFYKRFYIVTAVDDNGLEYHIMVDAVDGGISVLDNEHSLAIDQLQKELLEEDLQEGSQDDENR